MVRPAKTKYPRMTMTPRTKQQLNKFFKNHAPDMADLVPNNQGQGGGGGGGDNGQSEPGSGTSNSSQGSNGGGQSQRAPATNAGMYFYSYSVGTPPQTVSGALDISSELVWTQCSCATCDVSTSTTPFDPSLSTTVADLPCTSTACQDFVNQTCDAPECTYVYMYRGGVANTTGYLATDTFTFDTTSRVEGVVFGCGFDSAGDFGGASGGVIGLGRGPLSLVSQLQADRFSYYFVPDDSTGNAESFIHFGDDATTQTSHAVSTPLLATSDDPNLYLVGLTGIKVDGKDLAIPRGTFDLQKDGSGGVVLSIAVPVTFLEESAYKLLRQAMASGIRLPTANGTEALGLDLCYTSQSLAAAKIPAVSLVFDGGATMELEVGNYFYMDAGSGLECLTILPSDSGTSLLGSLIQAGTHMIYDIRGSTLTFESLEQASPPSNSSQGASRPRRSSAPPPRSPVVIVHFFFWVVVFMVL
nr:unnamed protein product [Digitaria exilis]